MSADNAIRRHKHNVILFDDIMPVDETIQWHYSTSMKQIAIDTIQHIIYKYILTYHSFLVFNSLSLAIRLMSFKQTTDARVNTIIQKQKRAMLNRYADGDTNHLAVPMDHFMDADHLTVRDADHYDGP